MWPRCRPSDPIRCGDRTGSGRVPVLSWRTVTPTAPMCSSEPSRRRRRPRRCGSRSPGRRRQWLRPSRKSRACTGSLLIRVAHWLPRPGSMPTGLRISRRRSEPRPRACVGLNRAEDRPSMRLSRRGAHHRHHGDVHQHPRPARRQASPRRAEALAFNTARRDDPNCPDDVRSALRWATSHTRPVSALRDPRLLRQVLDGLTVKLDGTPAAPSVTSRRRRILHAALEYAVELELLDKNPMPALKWTPPKTTQTVDRRRVANPIQARTLLHAVGEQRGGRRLVAFFGCLYYAALRPEEAISLAKHNLSLPARGWGELHVERAEPYAGKEWTDSGRNRDQRPLKQRARGEVRVVPCPPALTELLHAHIAEFGIQPDGRLFVGERNGGELPTMTIGRMWRRARQAALTPEVAASPLARTPYDLRHAAVSTWLNGGVPPTTVAEWAGHSVEVLLRIYAKCLDGGDALIRQRVQAALGYADTDNDNGEVTGSNPATPTTPT